MEGWLAGWTDNSFEGLIRAGLAGSGHQLQTPWAPTLPSGRDDSQAPRLGGDGSWRCGYSLPGLQAGGESSRQAMHSSFPRVSKVRTLLHILDVHFGVSPLGWPSSCFYHPTRLTLVLT